MRHVAVDVETTGLRVEDGHRVISVACVELVDRQLTGREFYRLVNPERPIPEKSFRIHGISNEQVAGQPRFSDLAGEFLDFVRGAELLGHNLEFDRGFLDEELRRAGREERLEQLCKKLTCTLHMARARWHGQRNNLDDLCHGLGIKSDEHSRGRTTQSFGKAQKSDDDHLALGDARATVDVWLKMTQVPGELEMGDDVGGGASEAQALSRQGLALARFEPSGDDLERHREMLEMIDGKSEQGAAWLKDF
ncbi:MAG: exonuclease domain-containing protein [Gammaproteobacteria bacterium]|nr:exonuclease domain-containing protein [Gammaproteobacteria bacterium]